MSGGCERARLALDRRFDGESQPAEELRGLTAHLEACAACRRLEAELAEVRRRLRAMPPQRFPDEALEAVWARTSRPALGAASRTRWLYAAAAAVVAGMAVTAIGLGGLWSRPGTPGPSDAELRRAAAESRLVLQLTAQAMRRTERVAVRDVLGGDVSGALRRVPIDWPAADPAAGTNDGSGR